VARAGLLLLAGVAAAVAAASGHAAHRAPAPGSAVWPGFGYDAAGSDDGPATTGITAANLSTLVPRVVSLPGTVDSSPVYLRNVPVRGSRRDVYVVDTAYGRTLAVDAASGAILWQFVPKGISSWEGSLQITTSSPVVDPGLRYVYAASPDGEVHKIALADGREVHGRWPVRVTYNPRKEKISSSLEVYGTYVLAALAGFSDKTTGPDLRVGHLVEIDRATGRIAHVFNTLCSERTAVIRANSCNAYQAGIWARLPAPVDPAGNLLVAVADGLWNGRTNWGDTVLELSPALVPLQSYTPAGQAHLEIADLDLGSSAPAILTKHLVLQSGKDGRLRLLSLDRLNGRKHAAGRFLGGELWTGSAPGGGEVLTRPAVWHRPGGEPWVFVANGYGLAGYRLVLRPEPHLQLMWSDGRPGSSPVVAGGLLYSYNVAEGGLGVFDPDPPTGTAEPNEPLLTLPIPRGHWNSPVVADGRIALGDGDANRHETTGSLYVWSLPTRSRR
jgi:PQQ-like domain